MTEFMIEHEAQKSRPLGDFYNMFDWFRKVFKFPVTPLYL